MRDKLLEQHSYRFAPGARETFEEYLTARIRQPHFATRAVCATRSTVRAAPGEPPVCQTRIGASRPKT